MKTKILTMLLLVATIITTNAQTIWNQIGQDIDGEAAYDQLGNSVSLSSDGSIVAIGAYGNDANGTNAGHVRVYQNNAGTWNQIGQDIDGEAVGDQSGSSVSLSSDGSILAIGAYYNNGNGTYAGHVRVYQNNAGTWSQIGQDIDGEAAYDYSGCSVSLSSDGSIVAIGAYKNDGNGTDAGHVRVYQNNAGTWSQIGQDIDGEAAYDQSGYSVSLSSDGSILAIGATGNSGNGTSAGHVRVYQNNAGTWNQIGQDIDGEAANDNSGNSVSLSSDGSILAIGAYLNDGNGSYAGHVRVYQNNAGTWSQIGQDIDGEAAGDKSGYSVSLSSDGSILAIGAIENDGNGSGAGHVRVYQNNAGTWSQIEQDIDGEAAYDNSGYSVSLSFDGSILAIGATGNDGNGTYAGHVRVYSLCGTTSTITETACDTYTSPAGNIYTTTGTYIDTIPNAAGCDSVITINLTVNQSVNITTQPTSQELCENQNATFNVLATGTDLNYQWQINGIDTIGAIDNLIDLPNVQLSDAGNYICEVSNMCGTEASDVAILTVNPLPIASFTTTSPIETEENCLITYTGETSTSDTYAWDFDGATTSPTGIGPHNITWTNFGTKNITLTVTNDNGCVSTQVSNDVIVNPSSSFTISSEVCAGDTVIVTYTGLGSVSATYTWNFDGGIISSGVGQGPYQVTWMTAGVKNVSLQVTESGYTSSITQNTITVNSLPVISLQDYNQCLGSFTTIDANVSSGTPTYNYDWSQGGASNSIIVAPEDTTSYTLIVTDSKGCKDTAETTVNVLFPYIEQLCMVTVDTLTGSNMVIWEKTAGMRTEKYRIYRESVVGGVYDLLNEQDYGDMSEYIDATASPMQEAYKYKITTIDSVCANESSIDSCEYHKTILLQTSQGSPYGYNLSWEIYEGFPYGTYNIYGRETGIGNFTLIHQTAYGNEAWTDLTTAPSMEYRIAVYKSDPCIPTSDAKTSGGPYNQSISNIDDYSTGINDNNLSLNNIYIYPNPCSGVFTVRGEDITKIEVTDVNGKTIFVQDKIVEFNNIDLSHELKGIYFVKIISGTLVSTQKLIIK